MTNRTRCTPPLEPAEVERIAESICRYAPATVPTTESLHQHFPARTTLVNLRDGRVVTDEEVRRWLR